MHIRHVLITGGSRGIGLAIARLFAQHSYRCTLLSRNEEALKTAIASLNSKHFTKPKSAHLSHRYIVGDVSDPELWTPSGIGKELYAQKAPGDAEREDQMVVSKEDEVEKEDEAELPRNAPVSMRQEETQAKGADNSFQKSEGTPSKSEAPTHRNDDIPPSKDTPKEDEEITMPTPEPIEKDRVDVLVNCAGITSSTVFVRGGKSSLKSVVDTNLTGLMMGTQFLLRYYYMRRYRSDEDVTDSPVVINVASLLAVRGGDGAAAYSASKAGVLGTFSCLSC